MKIKPTKRFAKILIIIIALISTTVVLIIKSSFRAEEPQNSTTVIYAKAVNNNRLVSGLASLVSDKLCQEQPLAFSSGYTKCTTVMGVKVTNLIINDLDKSVNYSIPLSKAEYHSTPVALTSPSYYLQIEIGVDNVITVKQLLNGEYIDITETGIIP